MDINLSKGKSWIKKNWIRSNVEYFRALRFLMEKYEEKDICVVFVKDICAIKSLGTLNCRAWRLSWQYVEKWETSNFTATICLLEYSMENQESEKFRSFFRNLFTWDFYVMADDFATLKQLGNKKVTVWWHFRLIIRKGQL